MSRRSHTPACASHRVGTVASLQTLGGYAANFHPHVHALITEGVFHPPRSATPSFEWVAGWDVTAIAELFRRRVLARLRQARRLREHTEQMLLSWEHSGFSVWAGEPIRPGDTERQEHVARYVTRAPVRLDAIERKDQGKVLVQTPYDPRTGQRTLELDDLELIRRLCAQIPAPRQHLVRYFGWYSSRARGDRGRRKSGESGNGAPRSEVDVRADTEHRDDSPAARSRRRSWARL
ncbi:MAG TPA: transposase, partial [Candidatus Krumholzibacteria bacterium]|nr:transposase [Candidatus Krumholzibacteria bacterium]